MIPSPFAAEGLRRRHSHDSASASERAASITAAGLAPALPDNAGPPLSLSAGSSGCLPPYVDCGLPAPIQTGRASQEGLRLRSVIETREELREAARLAQEVADRVRSVSDGEAQVRSVSMIQAVLHPAAAPVRMWGEGDGWWWQATDVPAPNAQQRRMAQLAAASSGKTSWLPLAYWLPNFAGKIGMAVGADLLMEGLSRSGARYLYPGVALLTLGTISSAGGMTMLVRDIRQIHARTVPLYLGCSVAGTALVAGALVLAVSDLGQTHILARTAAFLIMTGGLSLLTYTLPYSFACSELVRGRVFVRGRAQVQLAAMALGMSVSALTLTRSASSSQVKFPFALGHAIAVLGVGLITLAAAIGASDYHRAMAGRVARRMLADERQAQAQANPV